MRYTLVLLAAASLAACGDDGAANNEPSEPSDVVVKVVNSTGLPKVFAVVICGDAGSIFTFTPTNGPFLAGTETRTPGAPVQIKASAGEEYTEHTCHIHADAIDNEDNVPTAVIYSEPLRIVCQSGWQEEETE
jgi:hypothetical protein